MTEAKPLHLPDLYIEGFRGIDQLTIPRLGRVTLLAGKNGIGKTTVLDAVRVYAARGSHAALYELLVGNEEYFFDKATGDSNPIPDVEALFNGREESLNRSIVIGPSDDNEQLKIESATPDEIYEFAQREPGVAPSVIWNFDGGAAVKTTFQDVERIIPLGFIFRGQPRYRNSPNKDEIKCESLGPDLMSNRDLARLWDNVALTDDESLAIEPLKRGLDNGIKGVAVIGDDVPGSKGNGRRVMVRLKSHRRPVPLRSLGDGAMRMFGVALALANSRDGFLLLDEAENGIHHTLQRDFWRMALQTAQANNVQVLATTHSWDCVVGFARAAAECEEAEGILYRLSRRYGDLRAVDYTEEDLKIAAEQGIEVR